MRKGTIRILLSALLVSALSVLTGLPEPDRAIAQTIEGRISGTVTDATGAIIAGADVKITNEATGLARTVKTDDRGFYVATSLPVGNYGISVEHTGFKKALKTGYTLVADGRLTVDFDLEPGAVNESVTVVAAHGETINTTSGEIARVIDTAQVQDLALNGRNYMQLTELIPGAPFLNDDQLSLTTSLSVAQNINGNRSNQNLLSIDGGFNLDSGSNNSQINNVGIDFIQEVNIKTSNFSAEYGRNSGSSINIVTRSGGNQFHGGGFEFLRNNQLDANNFFNNARGRFTNDATAKAPNVIVGAGDPRLGKEVVPRPALRFNDFGWDFGGPIKRDKLFFFVGQEWKYIRQFAAAKSATIPDSAERSGNFQGVVAPGKLIDPTTKQPFPNNVIPPQRITADGRAIANLYGTMAGVAAAYTDTPTGNNALFVQANPFNWREEIARIDYRINDHHSLYGRFLHDNYDLIDPFGTFINSALPTIPTNRLRPGFSYLVGYTWLISPTLINDAKINASWNGQRIPPVGTFWERSTYGFTYPLIFGGTGGRFGNGIPDTSVTGFAGFNGPAQSLLSPTTDIAASDDLSIIRGNHTLKTGVLVIRNRKDQNGRSNYDGTLAFSSSGNPNSTGNAFADALLGNFRTYSESPLDPIGFFRFSQYEWFVTDNWKVTRTLSIEAGLRYEYQMPTYTQANNIANFDPGLYDPRQAVTVLANGTIDLSKGGNRYNGLVRAGNGVPSSEAARVPNANSSTVLAVPGGAPRGLYKPASLLAPRFSFAWAPESKTAIRGGFGIFYDKSEGNLIFPMVNLPPYSSSVQFENGNLANPTGGKASAVAPFGNINAIDPKLRIPYSMDFSLSVQRELPGNVFAEVAFVGNQGRHLIRQPDINQPTFDALEANQALPSAQRLSTNALRPYKGFSQILMRLSDTNSNYNSLQIYVTKRKGNLTLSGAYTYSKALTDSSNNTANLEDPFNRSFNYGPADFDRRHIFAASYTYRVPFFDRWTGVPGKVLSGWEISGITHFQTGPEDTIIGVTSIGNRRADYNGASLSLPSGMQGPAEWFNVKAFTAAPDTRRGNSGAGIVVGPGRNLWDLSLRKKFGIAEAVRMQFQADFFNAFNHTNLNNLTTAQTTVGDAAFGTISGAAPGRNIQLGLKLNF
jgi:hypothetical protein